MCGGRTFARSNATPTSLPRCCQARRCDLLNLADAVTPPEVFRFAAPCLNGDCVHSHAGLSLANLRRIASLPMRNPQNPGESRPPKVFAALAFFPGILHALTRLLEAPGVLAASSRQSKDRPRRHFLAGRPPWRARAFSASVRNSLRIGSVAWPAALSARACAFSAVRGAV